MGIITSYSRKALVIIVSLSFIFNTQSAQASTLAGGSGWRVASTVSNGIGVTVNGVKDVMVNGAKKTMTGVANVTPTAAQVGKFMGKNLAGAAVIGAMDLLLDGVDYVLDPANNRVTYGKPFDPENPHASIPKIYTVNNTKISATSSPDPNTACNNYYLKQGGTSSSYKSYRVEANDVIGAPFKCILEPYGWPTSESKLYIFAINNPVYDPSAEEPQPKSIPLVNLGSQVLDKAEEEIRTGNPAVPIATPVTQAAATAVVGEAATDETQARPITAELDKSAAIPTDQTAVGEIAPPTTNPETGQPNPTPLSLEFPVFCSWAPSLCLMADKVQQAITDVATEYADKPQENNDTELEIPEPEQIEVDTDISFGGSCPAPLTSQVNFMGINETIEFSFENVCEIAAFIKPVVISVSAFSAALIVAGTRTEDD